MTKEQLRQYRSRKIEINQMEDMLAVYLHAHHISEDILHPLILLYREKLAALVETQTRIERAIESLNPTERTLMRLRYIDGAEWVDVAATIHYEWTQTHRIHASALRKLEKL